MLQLQRRSKLTLAKNPILVTSGTEQRLSRQQRRKIERELRDEALIQKAIDDTPETATHTSEIGAKSLVTHAQLADEDVKRNRPTRPCITPAMQKRVGPAVVMRIYTPADYDYLMAGWYCPRCEELQVERAEPDWVVRDNPKLCENRKGRGCGWPKGVQYIPLLPFAIERL